MIWIELLEAKKKKAVIWDVGQETIGWKMYFYTILAKEKFEQRVHTSWHFYYF